MPYFLKPREIETPQNKAILHHGASVTEESITSQGAVGVTWDIKQDTK